MSEDTNVQTQKEISRANLKRVFAIVIVVFSIFGLFYTIFFTIFAFDCWGLAALFGFIIADLAILGLDYLMIRMFRNQGKKIKQLIRL